jgi:hypothetical protein
MKTSKYKSLSIIFIAVFSSCVLVTSIKWINPANAQVVNPPVPQVSGDILQMRNGKQLQGSFISGDTQTIKFTTVQGQQAIPRDQVLIITFGVKQAISPVPVTQKTVPVQAQPAIRNPQTVAIPAGTVLMVSMANQVSSEDAAGRRFSAKLAVNLTAGNVVVANSGTTVYGRVAKSAQAGRLIGRSQLELNLTEININGKMYPLMTTNFAEAGKGSFRKTARNVGLGALVGGAFGDSDDAKKGAAIGAGLSVVRKGQSVVVPAGAVLEFRMTQPLTITI